MQKISEQVKNEYVFAELLFRLLGMTKLNTSFLHIPFVSFQARARNLVWMLHCTTLRSA
jgi:hypothetical protein